jgi:hypothetical protein
MSPKSEAQKQCADSGSGVATSAKASSQRDSHNYRTAINVPMALTDDTLLNKIDPRDFRGGSIIDYVDRSLAKQQNRPVPILQGGDRPTFDPNNPVDARLNEEAATGLRVDLRRDLVQMDAVGIVFRNGKLSVGTFSPEPDLPSDKRRRALYGAATGLVVDGIAKLLTGSTLTDMAKSVGVGNTSDGHGLVIYDRNRPKKATETDQ